jgi:uncharacterized membrane protein
MEDSEGVVVRMVLAGEQQEEEDTLGVLVVIMPVGIPVGEGEDLSTQVLINKIHAVLMIRGMDMF